jgi:glycosyltransferase involved in cell wall biosynthesis
MSSKIQINTRNLNSSISGVQRYTNELLVRFNQNEILPVAPHVDSSGFFGHLWEQIYLPLKLKNSLLWSPANTGPLFVNNQIVTIHDLSIFDANEGFNPKFIAWYKFLLPRLANRVRKVITDSEFSKNRIIELLKVDPIKVFAIPLGVDSRFTRSTDFQIKSVLNELKIPSSQYILSLGSLEPRKNLKRLIEAWAKIHTQIPKDVWLVIAGGTGENHVFKNLNFSEIPERIFFTGRIQDNILPTLYSGAQFFVYPSVYEGFGLPPLESMSCGTPVITGNLTSLPEVVGTAGLMVDPYCVDEIADAIVFMLENESRRKIFAEKSLSKAKEFNWNITAKKTWEILTSAG